MTKDSELRATLADWRRHAVSALITLIPMAFAAAMAWGLMTGRLDAVSKIADRNTMNIDKLSTRVEAVERQNAVVIQRLDDIKQTQDRMDGKLDSMASRGR